MTDSPDTPTAPCPLHEYTEMSARNKLARHRKRGEENWSMFHCPWRDHWHVIEGTVDEFINEHRRD